MSQSQELVPTIYENEAKMLNGHNGDVPPQLGMLQIEAEIGIGQARIVQELVEAVVVGDAMFYGLRVFAHALSMSGDWRFM